MHICGALVHTNMVLLITWKIKFRTRLWDVVYHTYYPVNFYFCDSCPADTLFLAFYVMTCYGLAEILKELLLALAMDLLV